MNNQNKYNPTPHLIAFVDALGFSREILRDNSDKLNTYFRLIEEIKLEWRNRAGKQELKVTTVGDSIVLSVKHSGRKIEDNFFESTESGFEEKLYNLCFAVGELQSGLAVNDIWTRGAITYHSIDTTNGRLVGPAFHRAYSLESQIAKFPRVILDGRITNAARCSTAQELVIKVNQVDAQIPVLYSFYSQTDLKLTDDVDLPHDIPTFVDFARIMPKGIEEKRFFEITSGHIAKRLRENVEYYPKYRWVADYYFQILKHDRKGNSSIIQLIRES